MYNEFMTKVIAAFPGTGKSYLASTIKRKVIDLDTGDYTQGYADSGKVRNPNFPDNYINAIKNRIGETDLLFVGCQPEVIAALRHMGVGFILVYPRRELKAEYVKRFQQRDSPQSFIDLLSKNWDKFLDSLENQKGCEHFILSSEQYVGDIVSIDS